MVVMPETATTNNAQRMELHTYGGRYLYITILMNMQCIKNESPAVAKNRQRTATITLPVTNDNGTVFFEDLLAELSRMYQVEMNAKNLAYSYILHNGYLDAYGQFMKERRGNNHHADCIELLINNAKL